MKRLRWPIEDLDCALQITVFPKKEQRDYAHSIGIGRFLADYRHNFTNYDDLLGWRSWTDEQYWHLKSEVNRLISEYYGLVPKITAEQIAAIHAEEARQQDALAQIVVGQSYRINKPGKLFDRVAVCQAKSLKYVKICDEWLHPTRLEPISNP